MSPAEIIQARRVAQIAGAAIIVSDERCELVTVLDDGQDTTFRRGRR